MIGWTRRQVVAALLAGSGAASFSKLRGQEPKKAIVPPEDASDEDAKRYVNIQNDIVRIVLSSDDALAKAYQPLNVTYVIVPDILDKLDELRPDRDRRVSEDAFWGVTQEPGAAGVGYEVYLDQRDFARPGRYAVTTRLSALTCFCLSGVELYASGKRYPSREAEMVAIFQRSIPRLRKLRDVASTKLGPDDALTLRWNEEIRREEQREASFKKAFGVA